MGKILVIGASGTVGTELVKLLQSKGEAVVRATSRANAGADQAYVDLVKGEGVDAALAGVDRVFLLSPPGHVNQDELLKPVIDRARARGVRKAVLMTAMGANADDALPLRRAERHLERSGLAWNVIRPNWFMQNFNTFWIAPIRAQNRILLPVAKAKGSFIDARDIAAVAAELLTSDRHANQELDLTGPEALDHDQVAAILARETGRPIAFQDIPPEAMRSALLDAGLPRPYAEFLLVILGYFKAGYAERITDSVERVTGRRPTAFATYAKDYRASWLG
jgi:uncharacterized protein YbjT (DUF2867 family)